MTTTTTQKDSSTFLNETLLKGEITADRWLEDFLRDGPRPLREVQDESRRAGFSWSTICRVKDLISAKSIRQGTNGSWYWQLDDGRSEP